MRRIKFTRKLRMLKMKIMSALILMSIYSTSFSFDYVDATIQNQIQLNRMNEMSQLIGAEMSGNPYAVLNAEQNIIREEQINNQLERTEMLYDQTKMMRRMY